MDFALLQHEISVQGMKGTVSVGRGETEWRFTPERPWRAGEYRIVVRTTHWRIWRGITSCALSMSMYSIRLLRV
jgi:hypothetical protein